MSVQTFEVKEYFSLQEGENYFEIPFIRPQKPDITGDQDPILDYSGPNSESVMELLSAKQQRVTEVVIRSMVDDIGLEAEYLRLILGASRGGNDNISVVDTSPNGQHIGNFDSIAKRREINPEWYKVNINNYLVDTLDSMTYRTYWSMICESNTRNILLQDSVALSHANDELWTATMLTGEELTEEGKILIASVSSNAVSNVGFRTNRGGSSIRIRPTVVIAESVDMKNIE